MRDGRAGLAIPIARFAGLLRERQVVIADAEQYAITTARCYKNVMRSFDQPPT